jgi:hypothetical protein
MGFFHQMHRTLWKNEHGFGLIDMSIALIIFSMLFGKGFSLWQIYNRARKHELTLQHQKLIFKALAHYLQQNGCLPYPCSIENLGNTKDGLGKSSAHIARDAPVHRGIVPYRTLFLPERVAKDGFGHFMTYAVDVHMTQKYPLVKSKMCKQFFSEQSALDIIENGQSVKKDLEKNPQKWMPAKRKSETGEYVLIKPNRYEGLAVILVSHGRHGWGAPQSSGQCIPFPTSLPNEWVKDKGTTFWSPESGPGAIEYGIVQGKTRTSILDDAYLGCADYFYAEDSKEPLTQGVTQKITVNAMAKPTFAGAHFTHSASSGHSLNPQPKRPPAPNAQSLQ